MSHGRKLAGWLCVGLAFGLIVMLGVGLIEPIGMPTGAASVLAMLLGLLPSVLLALVVFAIGLWLLRGATKR